MRALAHPLEVLAALVVCLTVLVMATGGWTVRGLSLTRPEDLVVALAALVALRLLVAPIEIPRVRPAAAVAVGVVLYVVLMGFIVVTRHLRFQTHALDLGYYVQVVWSIAAGYGPRVTLPPMHAWGDHFSPVLYLFVPLAWAVPGATALLLAQTAIFAAGAVAFYGYAARRLASRHDAPRLAAGFALLYLVNPSLHGVNVRDIHPQAFTIALLIGAALAYDARRLAWCAAALVLALAGREDCALAVAGFGIWLALARGRWIAGAGVAAVCVGLLVVDVTWVMPYFRESPYPHLHRYRHLGTSLTDILVTLIFRPWRWLAVVVAVNKLVYLGAMLAPWGFLPLLAPRTLAAALPGFAVNLMSLDPILVNYRTQYASFILPFLALAAIDGLATLRAWVGERPRSRLFSPGAALAFGFLASVVLTARTVNDLALPRWVPTEERRQVRALVDRIPLDAAVSTNERLVPHLATRREVHIFPVGVGRSEYLLEREAVIAQAALTDHAVVGRGGGWALLRRGP